MLRHISSFFQSRDKGYTLTLTYAIKGHAFSFTFTFHKFQHTILEYIDSLTPKTVEDCFIHAIDSIKKIWPHHDEAMMNDEHNNVKTINVHNKGELPNKGISNFKLDLKTPTTVEDALGYVAAHWVPAICELIPVQLARIIACCHYLFKIISSYSALHSSNNPH